MAVTVEVSGAGPESGKGSRCVCVPASSAPFLLLHSFSCGHSGAVGCVRAEAR